MVRRGRIGASRPEYTGERSGFFSAWHRYRAYRECFFTDVDCLEYRQGRETVALLEVKRLGAELGWSQRQVLVDLARCNECRSERYPLLLVRYGDRKLEDQFLETGDLQLLSKARFLLEGLNSKGKALVPEPTWHTSDEFREFLKAL